LRLERAKRTGERRSLSLKSKPASRRARKGAKAQRRAKTGSRVEILA